MDSFGQCFPDESIYLVELPKSNNSPHIYLVSFSVRRKNSLGMDIDTNLAIPITLSVSLINHLISSHWVLIGSTLSHHHL